MARDVVLYTDDLQAATREILTLGGRVTHQFTANAFVASLPDAVDEHALARSSPTAPETLDPISKLAVMAWEAREAKAAQLGAAPDETQGLSWDAPGMTPPDPFLTAPALGLDDEVQESTGTPTSLYMIGSVAVGVVMVSGAGELALSSDEQALVLAEVQEGLDFLANAEPRANITFVYDIRPITVNVAPGLTDTYEHAESPWRNAALQQMGFSPSVTGSGDYVRDLQAKRNTRWAVVAYFTKYPLRHFAYAVSERLVMAFSNDGWGSQNINRVFAHEFCHLFGAADEYGSCSCGPSGHLAVPNNNCVQCPPPHLECLMDGNVLSLCDWSRGQIGWDPRLLPSADRHTVGLILYKQALGTAAFHQVQAGGQDTRELGRSQWLPGWTVIKPFVLGGQVHQIAYRQLNGTVAIGRLADDGGSSTELWRGAGARGWTILEPVASGDSVFLFKYKQADGTVAIDRVAPDGRGVTQAWTARWSTGWTIMEPFELNGEAHLLSYKAGDGTVAIDVFDPAGQGTTEIWRDRWSRGWTTIKPFVENGQVHVLSYNRGTGAAAITRVASDGRGANTIWNAAWTTGWTTIEPFVLDGQPHTIQYKVNVGTVAIERIAAGAAGVDEIWRDRWTRGWTVIEPFVVKE